MLEKLVAQSVTVVSDISGSQNNQITAAFLLFSNITPAHWRSELDHYQSCETPNLGYTDIVKRRSKQDSAKELLRLIGDLDGRLLVLSVQKKTEPGLEPLFAARAYERLKAKGYLNADWNPSSFERAQLKAAVFCLLQKHGAEAGSQFDWIDDTDETNDSDERRQDQLILVRYYQENLNLSNPTTPNFATKADAAEVRDVSDMISAVDLIAGHWNEHFTFSRHVRNSLVPGTTITIETTIPDDRKERFRLVQTWFFEKSRLSRLAIRIDADKDSHKISRVLS